MQELLHLHKIDLPIITPDRSDYSYEDILNTLEKNIKEIKVFPQLRGTGTGVYKKVILPKNLLIDGDYGDKYIYIKNLQMKIKGINQEVVIKFGKLSSMTGSTVEALGINDETFQTCLQEHQQNS